jgi:hypothetical protein
LFAELDENLKVQEVPSGPSAAEAKTAEAMEATRKVRRNGSVRIDQG